MSVPEAPAVLVVGISYKGIDVACELYFNVIICLVDCGYKEIYLLFACDVYTNREDTFVGFCNVACTSFCVYKVSFNLYRLIELFCCTCD